MEQSVRKPLRCGCRRVADPSVLLIAIPHQEDRVPRPWRVAQPLILTLTFISRSKKKGAPSLRFLQGRV